MESLLTSKRSKSIICIVIFAISIGLISKKIINYPFAGCMKKGQELTFMK